MNDVGGALLLVCCGVVFRLLVACSIFFEILKEEGVGE